MLDVASGTDFGMVAFGYTLMTEQAGPSDLVRHAVAAEEAGFDFLAMSDHYSPWLVEQGTRRTPGACWAQSRRPRSGSR